MYNAKDHDDNDNETNITTTSSSTNNGSSITSCISSSSSSIKKSASTASRRKTVSFLSSSTPNSMILKLSIVICFILFEFNAFQSINVTTTTTTNNDIVSNKKREAFLRRSESTTVTTDNLTTITSSNTQLLLPPLIFGIGQGTTGTHSMFLSTCHLNITSVHGIETCLYGLNHTDVSPQFIDGFKAHALSIKYYKKLRHCANSNIQCTFADAVRYVTKLKYYIKEVIMSPIGALHDTPYTFMTPYVIETSKQVRGIEPILINSERDSIKWSSRRAQRHPIAIVCKYFFEQDKTPPQGLLGAFDLDKCIQMAQQYKQEGSRSIEKFEDVFMSYRQLITLANGNETLLQKITENNRIAIDLYQTTMKQQYKPIYTIDMFQRATDSSLITETENDNNDDSDESEDGSGFVDAYTIATELDEVLWDSDLTTLEQQERLHDANVTLMKIPVPHRKGRYSRMHPFLKGLIKCNGTHPIVG